MKHYTTIVIGSGPGGIFSTYQLVKNNMTNILVIDSGNCLEKRYCPMSHTDKCLNCNTCSVINGFGGAGAFSDGKYNITTNFGGTLHEYLGVELATELMEYVDKINTMFRPNTFCQLYTTDETLVKTCLQNDLHLLTSKVRHLGTDINYQVLSNIYTYLSEYVTFKFNTSVTDVQRFDNCYKIITAKEAFTCDNCIISVGRSGSKWIKDLCDRLNISYSNNQVDIGVRVELPADVFDSITDKVYESKIVYRTKKYQDLIRTFCMNPKGSVVTENTRGIVTVNGHSYTNSQLQTKNTNFALLVGMQMTEPFSNSNEYGEAIARLSNMLGEGVLVQRFGDLIRNQRTNEQRLKRSFVKPTLNATPGDLSLVMPKRILDDIIEMIYQLDKIAPGTANDDTLLYGVEVKFYNIHVNVNSTLEALPNLYIIGDGSGITHSLSQASASGIYAAQQILARIM